MSLKVRLKSWLGLNHDSLLVVVQVSGRLTRSWPWHWAEPVSSCAGASRLVVLALALTHCVYALGFFKTPLAIRVSSRWKPEVFNLKASEVTLRSGSGCTKSCQTWTASRPGGGQEPLDGCSADSLAVTRSTPIPRCLRRAESASAGLEIQAWVELGNSESTSLALRGSGCGNVSGGWLRAGPDIPARPSRPGPANQLTVFKCQQNQLLQ